MTAFSAANGRWRLSDTRNFESWLRYSTSSRPRSYSFDMHLSHGSTSTIGSLRRPLRPTADMVAPHAEHSTSKSTLNEGMDQPPCESAFAVVDSERVRAVEAATTGVHRVEVGIWIVRVGAFILIVEIRSF